MGLFADDVQEGVAPRPKSRDLIEHVVGREVRQLLVVKSSQQILVHWGRVLLIHPGLGLADSHCFEKRVEVVLQLVRCVAKFFAHGCGLIRFQKRSIVFQGSFPFDGLHQV